MSFGFMVESCMTETASGIITELIDLGYWKDAEPRYTAIRSFGIARKNFEFVGNGRVFLKCPPRKRAALFAGFPIVEGSTYWRATHHWNDQVKP